MRDDQSRRSLDIPVGDRYIVVGNPFRRVMKLLRDLLQIFRRKPEPPGYPYADKLAPIRRGPKGRSSAAVADLDDEPPRR
jgi:hypothetical protein